MAKSKAGGSTRLGRDSQPKYLGVKRFDGEAVDIGYVLVCQRGSRFRAGKNVRMGHDNTLYAVFPGYVKFTRQRKRAFTGKEHTITKVNVYPQNYSST
ncbi:MAG: 50S ribosomal protein L27 [Parcubacteria group bacterium SW_4_49_11]|nr:MAG: 50S ribosomal protein L27 [Parcubacteria group bacterium SW_4_49_11]